MAESPKQGVEHGGDGGQDEDALATPAIGQNARGQMQQRDEAGITGGHQAQGGLVKPKTFQKHLLNGSPEHQPL